MFTTSRERIEVVICISLNLWILPNFDLFSKRRYEFESNVIVSKKLEQWMETSNERAVWYVHKVDSYFGSDWATTVLDLLDHFLLRIPAPFHSKWKGFLFVIERQRNYSSDQDFQQFSFLTIVLNTNCSQNISKCVFIESVVWLNIEKTRMIVIVNESSWRWWYQQSFLKMKNK